MRNAVAIPACALVAGTAAGVCLRAPLWLWWLLLFAGWSALAIALFVRRGVSRDRARAPAERAELQAASRALFRGGGVGRVALAAASAGFFGAGATLGAIDAARARRPLLLEALAAAGRDPTACGRTQADCTTLVQVEGRLRDDAAVSEFGISFTLDVTHILQPLGTAPELLAREESRAAEAWPHTRRQEASRAARPVDGRIRVTVAGARARNAMHEWRAGRTMRAPVTVRAPLPYRNFGLPDQRDRLALAGLTLFGSIKSAALVQIVAPAVWWRERAADARGWIRSTIQRHVPDPVAAAIATAVLIGDRAALPAEVEQRLQRAGTYHVIAISGGNIAILAGTVLALLRLSPIASRMRPALAAVVICGYGLIVEEGESVRRATWAAVAYLLAKTIDLEARSMNVFASVVACMLIATPLSIVSAAFWLTCGATLGILLHAGPWLHRPRRQAGVEGTGSRLRAWSARFGWICAAMCVTTLAAEVMVLPVSAFFFSQVTAAGLLLNLLAIPLMTIVQLSGLALLACAAVADLAGAAVASCVDLPVAPEALATLSAMMTAVSETSGGCTRHAAEMLIRSAHLVEYAAWLARRVPAPPLWLIGAYFACWSAIWLAPELLRRRRTAAAPDADDARALRNETRRRRARLIAIAAWSFCLLLIVLAPPLPRLSLPPAVLASAAASAAMGACVPEPIPPDWRERRWLRLTMLDVGQGSAALLDTSSRAAILVDAAGTASPSFDIGARIVSPALWALGLRRLDALAITHGDLDHAGGAPAILEDFAPRSVWTPAMSAAPQSSTETDARLARLAAAARARRISWRTLAAGEEVPLAPATAQVWHPVRTRLEHTTGQTASRLRNDDSLVLHVRLGDVSLVLPGDIGASVERRLASELTEGETHPTARAPPAPLSVLLTPHHGSGSSSSVPFLDALAPRVALVSVGLGNRHGHPAPAVLARYRARGTELFRTDREGAIQLLTDGRSVRIRTCVGRQWRATATRVPRRARRPAARSRPRTSRPSRPVRQGARRMGRCGSGSASVGA